ISYSNLKVNSSAISLHLGGFNMNKPNRNSILPGARLIVLTVSIVGLAIPFAVFAQDIARAPAAEVYLLKEGTEVDLKFAQDSSSKTAAEDDRVNFELAEDVKVGDVTVAKAGAKAVGTVTHVKKAGMMGKGG